ncbi:hypothetical protein B0H15DRAFT_856588 [Mycena belliarum]|uniref:Uncharacterized protein n=1 Tax=Mycena belliarum TaxID=1033014 RepID=A0AAD6XK79_9AGAR|nr:hypothetical protein B0H15DRAFT_856588 [Mycena belliae]
MPRPPTSAVWSSRSTVTYLIDATPSARWRTTSSFLLDIPWTPDGSQKRSLCYHLPRRPSHKRAVSDTQKVTPGRRRIHNKARHELQMLQSLPGTHIISSPMDTLHTAPLDTLTSLGTSCRGTKQDSVSPDGSLSPPFYSPDQRGSVEGRTMNTGPSAELCSSVLCLATILKSPSMLPTQIRSSQPIGSGTVYLKDKIARERRCYWTASFESSLDLPALAESSAVVSTAFSGVMSGRPQKNYGRSGQFRLAFAGSSTPGSHSDFGEILLGFGFSGFGQGFAVISCH